SAPREDTGYASMAVETAAVPPVLGSLEKGWRLPSAGDFNRDGVRDLVWRDHTSNRYAVGLLRGPRVLEQRPMLPGPPGEDWMVVNAAGDFNGDGRADMLWYNWTTNQAFVSLTAGVDRFERGPELPGPPGDGWSSTPARDF